MNAICRPPRGTHDLLGKDIVPYRHVTNTAEEVAALYGYKEWITPIFEESTLFTRSLGETSDVVSKEMYNFEDRSGTSLTLRPEGTASIIRALVTNGLTQTLPQKVFYCGPMFRYERPQKGRYRQFTQFGAENIGVDFAWQDAETIRFAADLLNHLGITDTVLQINTLGDLESRNIWRSKLVEYFSKFETELSEDSRIRLKSNPLRILDSKNPNDQKIASTAPTFKDSMNLEAQTFWDELRQSLNDFGVKYVENSMIVRGLDYYSHTAFEFVTDRLGSQGTVLGGGRYEGLVEEFGGGNVKAVGWAAGVERLAALVGDVTVESNRIVILPGESDFAVAAKVANLLREHNYIVEIDGKSSLKKRMERAVKSGYSWVILIDQNEDESGTVRLRNLANRQQDSVSIDNLVGKLGNK